MQQARHAIAVTAARAVEKSIEALKKPAHGFIQHSRETILRRIVRAQQQCG